MAEVDVRRDRDFALVLLRHAVEHFCAAGAPQMLDWRCELCRAIHAVVPGAPINVAPMPSRESGYSKAQKRRLRSVGKRRRQ